VGNYNALHAAFPDRDWPKICKQFIEDTLDLEWNGHTTQIEPRDWLAEYMDTVVRLNTICLDLCRDMWGYASMGYVSASRMDHEIGSSTMPHKINPIHWENAEGNLGVANALLSHLARVLCQSRFQRDLSDSTAMRNVGVALGHSWLAYESMLRGLVEYELDAERMWMDLECRWELLTEPVQTVMRSEGLPHPYETVQSWLHQGHITRDELHQHLKSTGLSDKGRSKLLSLTPATYLGLAPSLARPPSASTP
jgi:adenylosuccinate lyase